MTSSSLSVRAPGSTANLGPGFDALGLAVSLYCTAHAHGEGEPCGPDHIARIAYEKAGGTGSIWFDFNLPPGRGLGFSAAARAAGAVLAFAEAGHDIEEARRLGYEVVYELEGHGDNAAPAVFGGMHVIAGDINFPITAPFPGDLMFWVMEAQTATDDSRARLPAAVTREDAVFNIGRAALLVASIYEGDTTHFQLATQDRIHQDIRFLTRPRSHKAMKRALSAGALAAWLSGSGPTIAIVCAQGERDQVAESLPSDGQIYQLSVDRDGCKLV